MTKAKKHSRPTLEDVINQPWCYYCEKTYTDVGALLSHQKDKHFQCPCRRRLNTAGGLKVHMAQVHKEELKEVPNALPHRKDPSVEVFTTVGIPEDVLRQHRQEVETEFYRQEYEHRLRTGNPAPGTVQPGAVKKQKIESTESLKARVAARRAEAAARRAAEANGSSQPANHSPPQAATPTTASPAPANGAHPFTFNTGPNVFTHPAALPGQVPLQSNGLQYSAGHVASPIPTAAALGPPPGVSPIPAIHGLPQPPSTYPPNTNGHSIPSGPTPIPRNNGSSHSTSEMRTDRSNSHTPQAHESTSLSKSVSLPKLCKYGLDTIIAENPKNGIGGQNRSRSAELPLKPVDLFVAICDKAYGSASVISKLLLRAEDILRGLLRLGVDRALPTDFAYSDKVSSLRESIKVATTTAVPTDQDGDQEAKKNVEVRVLNCDSLSWEEELSLHREDEKGHSVPNQSIGPAADAVSGVVGDGEMGNSVMEE